MGNSFLNLALLTIIFHFPIHTTSTMESTTTIFTDQSALLALKHHVTLDPQNVLTTNWSTATSVCNWFGVSCGSKHRRVIALDLTGLGLIGSLPPHLGNLSFLSLLDITNNSFHGGLPVQLSNLRRLKHLSLVNNSFSGEIPSWLGSLTQLTELNLYKNNFKGVIPSSLGHLPKLEIVNLSENRISGSIPYSIFNISRLQVIDLSKNMISGSIPSVSHDLLSLELINLNFNYLVGHIPMDLFDHLPNLKILKLGANNISGRIPSSLFKCKELQMLGLSTNQMEGSLPVEIGNFSMLQMLQLSVNHFHGTIPREISNLKNLEFLDLLQNNISGSIPPEVFNISTLSTISLVLNQLSGHLPPDLGLWLPNLKKLYLGGNQLVGSIPESISNSSQLIHLDISQNYLSGSIPDTLGNLRNLEFLNLEKNHLTSPGMSFLSSVTKCRSLIALGFGGNPFTSGNLPALVGNLSGSLQKFDATECNFNGSIPSEIGNLSNLITIGLSGNKFTGKIPDTIGGLKELQSLSLTGNELEGSIPSELCHLNKLSFLFLTSNKLSGPIPACLGNLVSLRNLYLDSNMFSSSIPSTLTGLVDLLNLNLSSNAISGPLPMDIGKWKVLTSIDLSNNRFTGDIPTGVADLKVLTYISLSNNRITGSVPDSFGDLLSLEFLDLSRNNLSGEIPKSLEKLSYLKYFNVSFNRLEGEIPLGGSFGNYSAESFKGNGALCGAARLHVPSCKPKHLRTSKPRTKLIICVALPIASTILVAAVIIILIILQRRKRKDKLPTQEDSSLLVGWRRISYHQLHQATDGFSESRLLGNGSYGSVYKGILSDGMEFAVKVFNLEVEAAFKSFDVECDVLRNIRHRNLIKIISSCSNNLDFKALVLEFMPNGSFDKWLHSDNHFLDILQRLNIMIDVASALEYLHHGNANPVVHCDLKPNNVVLDNDMVAHLSDFGIAKLLSKEDSIMQTITIATIGYMAPEYGIEGIVSTKGDVYSFGILTVEAITRKKPIDEMFSEERSLKSWVKESISSPLNHVVDTNLLRCTGKQRLATNNCALSILEVGLECSAELPDERPDMKEIVTKLKKIKVKFLKDTEGVRSSGIRLDA